MKSTIVPQTKQKTSLKFPCLMTSKTTGMIVFFLGLRKGIVLSDTTFWKIGELYNYWDIDQFTFFTSQITLEN